MNRRARNASTNKQDAGSADRSASHRADATDSKHRSLVANLRDDVGQFANGWLHGWNRFWFRPTDPTMLAMIRLFAGAMLFYSLLIWGKDLLGFFGPDGRLPKDFSEAFYGAGNWTWSYLFWLDSSPTAIWVAHVLALVIAASYACGFQTRITGFLSIAIAISYANRAAGALFGLDQIVSFLILYTAVGPSGACLSVDAWIRRRRQQKDAGAAPSESTALASSGATVSIRLIQLHMCVVYLFAGLGKLQGETWWNGEAFWGAVANAEYQTIDLTWLASYPFLINIITLITIVWEVGYAALVWSARTRPIIVAMSIPLHLGIACAMGMITFGLVMLIGNLAFVSPYWIRRFGKRFSRLAIEPSPA